MIGTIQDITERKEFELALQKSNQHWQTLTEATRILNSELEPELILRHLVNSAMQLTGAQEGTAGLLIEGKMVFREYNMQGELIPIDYTFEEGYGVPGYVLKTKKPYLTNNAEGDEHVIPEIQKTLGFYNLLDTPIINRYGKVIGCFELHNKPDGFDNYDIMLLQNLASGTAIALENAQIIEQLKSIETALTTSESNLQSLINNRNESIWSLDTDYNLIVYNDFFRNSYYAAYGVELVIGINLISILLPELREFWKPKYDLALSGEKISYEFSETIQGEKFYFNIFLNPIFSDGKVTGVSALSIDVTELKTSQERMNALVEAIPDLIFVFSREGVFLESYCSSDTEIYAHPIDYIGKNISEVLPSHIAENTLFYLKKLFETGKLQVFNYFMEIENKQKFYESRLTLKGKNEALAVIRDMTEKKEAEEALIVSEEKFRKLFENHSAVHLLIDPQDGRIENANQAAADFYGWTIDELKAMRIHQINILPSNEIEEIINIAKTKGNFFFEFQHRLSNGLVRNVEVFSSRVNLFGKDYLHSIVHDVTEKKLLLKDLIEAKEKAEESDRLKSLFLANMSHEIRTPLNGILGFTQLLTGEELVPKPKRRDYSIIINKSADRLMQIINDILDISKLDAGQITVEKKKINLTDMLSGIYTLYRKKLDDADKTHIKLMLKNTEGLVFIESDENRLTQVFTNLLDNSVKFTSKGEIVFGVSKMDEYMIEFLVSDTGIGIKEENQQIIFNRFSQANENISKEFGGTGLGLSIVQKIIELMGGNIHVESVLGRGSTFQFCLPAKKIIDNSKNIPDIAGETKTLTSYLKVLLVEDDPISTLYYQEILANCPMELIMVANGTEALKIAKEFMPDVILMDIRLPDINGLEVVREIRKTDTKVKIIAQTAYAMNADEKLAMEAGCNDFITKPVNSGILIKKLSGVRK